MYLQDVGLVCALGNSKLDIWSRWLAGECLTPAAVEGLDCSVPALAVQAELPVIPLQWKHFDCRTNRLLLAASAQITPVLSKAVQRYGSDRIGLVLGTSTSGIAEGERAIQGYAHEHAMPAGFDYRQQALGGAAAFLAEHLAIHGPTYTVSTTCSSSAHALASARRLLRLGLCDAVVVGGSDSLCRTTLEGFSALGAVSRKGCNPFSRNRDGTIIGEGAALFLMSREPSEIALLGVGASADAYHISGPRPDGVCAYTAMQAAITDAGLRPEQVDYINLHGTGTLQNDAMESRAVHRLFGSQVACASSKPATGHCLGAGGAIEAGLCWLLLSALNTENRLPLHHWDGEWDVELPRLGFVRLEKPLPKRLQYCLSNSFSFGGNNVSLLIGRS